MFLTVLTVLLGALLLYAVWPRKEGLAQEYSDDASNATMVLVKQNEANIADLKDRMAALQEMGEQVNRIQAACDANTENISTLVESSK
jgi:hypothetical protein